MGYKKFESRRVQARKRRSTQRLWLLLSLGGVLLIAVAFILLRGNQGPRGLAAITIQDAPGLKVDKEQVDLGDVQLGQTVRVSFTLTNIGDQPLRLTEKPYVEVVEGC